MLLAQYGSHLQRLREMEGIFIIGTLPVQSESCPPQQDKGLPWNPLLKLRRGLWHVGVKATGVIWPPSGLDHV